MSKLRFPFLIFVVCSFIFTGCDEDNPVGVNLDGGQKAYVLNSISNTISIVDLDSLTVQNDVIQLGANSSAVGFTTRGNFALIPNGAENNALLLDLKSLTIEKTIDLPIGSGATGSAFLNDNTAFVCNLNLQSVSRIDLNAGVVTDSIAVDLAPSDVAITSGKIFVANANVDFTTFQPVGNGTISVINPATNQVVKTIDTGATNSQFLAIDSDGDLIVVNSGQFGAGNGSISVIDPEAETLTAGPFTIGDFPGSISINNNGVAYVASFSAGLYGFNTQTNTVTRGANNALAALVGGFPAGAAGVDFDKDGNIYSVNFGDATTPGTVYIFDAGETLFDSVKVGIGPFDIAIQ